MLECVSVCEHMFIPLNILCSRWWQKDFGERQLQEREGGKVMVLILSGHTGTFDSLSELISPQRSQTHLCMCVTLTAPSPDRYTLGDVVSALLCQEPIPVVHFVKTMESCFFKPYMIPEGILAELPSSSPESWLYMISKEVYP